MENIYDLIIEYGQNCQKNITLDENNLEHHANPYEEAGIKEMYKYVYSDDINYRFDIYTLLELHRKLYSKVPYPEVGGMIRNATAHFNEVAIDLVPHYEIRNFLKELDYEVQDIVKLGEDVLNDYRLIFEYIDRCIKLKCKLIYVHPFADGNKRSVRGFINKLLLNVSLPSVYIYEDEQVLYKEALKEAIGDNDYTKITNFYYYKIGEAIKENEATFHQKTLIK